MTKMGVVGAFLLSVVAFTVSAAIGGEQMEAIRSPVAPAADKVIHVSAFVAVSPARAFTYFTSNTLLQQWLTAVADVEAHVGGKYELFWQPDDRENNSTIGCRVTAIAPGQMLAFQWRSPRQFKPFANTADPLTHVVVTVLPEGSGARVHLVHSGWRSSLEWEEARAWQEKSWTGAFDTLKRVARE